MRFASRFSDRIFVTCVKSGVIPVSMAIDVTPFEVKPQGFISLNQSRSVVTLSARPCMVMPWLTLTPIAHIFRSVAVPVPHHTPVAFSIRSELTPKVRHVSMTDCSSRSTYDFTPK